MPYKSYSKINKSLKSDVINTIKILIYKENPLLLERIDFENDDLFLEPILFSYFNNQKNKLTKNFFLDEILQGYYTISEPIKIENIKNKDGIAYIPKLGYFSDEGKLDEIEYIDRLELLKEIHPSLIPYFIESYRGETANRTPEFSSIYKSCVQDLKNAIETLKLHIPHFYKQLIFSNKKIYLHNNPKILNFTSLETLGMLFFYVVDEENTLYFIEELIHQGSHNLFYYLIFDKKKYFKVDSEKILMRELTENEWDYRSLYGAFHGLFTVAQRLENFDILLSKNVFSGRYKHELLGRMTDQFSRFRTGLELLDYDKVFTEKGKMIYKQLDAKCNRIIFKYRILTELFDLKNRDLDFRYKYFIKYNSYNTFLRYQEKGQLKF